MQSDLHVAQRARRVFRNLGAPVRGKLREPRHHPETHSLLCPTVQGASQGHGQGHGQGEG